MPAVVERHREVSRIFTDQTRAIAPTATSFDKRKGGGMSERKAAIVTGSATGVGAATALGLARRGHDVLINFSKSEQEAKETAATCHRAGADTLVVQGDVAAADACRGMVEAAVTRWRRLDGLVNNAGITTFAGSANWDALDAPVIQNIMGVNILDGPFGTAGAASPAACARV